jgi:hypothetical protein
VAAEVNVADLEGAPGIWVRENLQNGYVPFTYPPDPDPGSNVSAELYCHTDIHNYDNYDEIYFPETFNTYYCVAFNALKDQEITPNPTPTPPPGGGNNPTGSISGTKFNDVDGDGQQGPGEPGLVGWTIYIDANNNDTFDSGEASATTGADGKYSITGLANGSYTVREVFQVGWTQIFPGSGALFEQAAIVSDGENTAFIDFGNKLTPDVGGCNDCARTFSSGGGASGFPALSTPQVLGANIVDTDPDLGGTSDPDPQVLGVSTELPRTGTPLGVWIAFSMIITGVFVGRKYKFELTK